MKKAFNGKQTAAEEKAEAKMVRSGKMTPAQYARAEKAEGDTMPTKSLEARGKQLASGKLSADKYASMGPDMPKMADGGMVGLARQGTGAPNECTYNLGPGVRSLQDYKK
jgi:hypothetical protein